MSQLAQSASRVLLDSPLLVVGSVLVRYAQVRPYFHFLGATALTPDLDYQITSLVSSLRIELVV